MPIFSWMVNFYRDAVIRKLDAFFNQKRFRGNGYILKLLKALKRKPSANMIVQSKYGFKLKIDPVLDKGVERSIYETGTYEEGTLWILSKIINKNDIVIDAGANIGLMTLFFAYTLKAKKVFSFEPMPTTYQLLLDNLRLNKVNNVETFALALSDKTTTGKIYPNLAINRGAASLNKSKADEEGIPIEIKRLDQVESILEQPTISFCKIDVEGSEFLLLKGSEFLFNQEIKPSLCLEFSKDVNSNNSTDAIYSLLVDTYSYLLFKSIRGKAIKSSLKQIKSMDDLPIHDNIYCFDKIVFDKLPQELFEEKI